LQCFFVERFFVETVDRSGRTLRKGDVLVVRKLDRLSRSLRDVLTIMERLPEAKAGFRSLIEAIDATTRLVVVLGEVLPPDTPKIRPCGK
jgi:DNA invertase Pin-like site-specific DNA recombinase